MMIASLRDIKNYAINSKYEIWSLAKELSRDPKIYLHWSAGRYYSYFDDYHININKDGELHIATTNFAEPLAHTYRRNTASIGISLCCAYNANTNNLGECPPTPEQIETMARVGCIIANAWDLTIDKNRVMTHGEAADNEDGYYAHDPYGPKSTCERWDLEFLGTNESPYYDPYSTNGTRGGDVLRGKMNWYRNTGFDV